MHATTEQLLEIKDHLQNDASLHVQSCACCQAELQALQNLEQQLLASADQQPDPAVWQRIVQAADAPAAALPGTNPEQRVPIELLAGASGPGVFRSLHTAVYTLAASIALTGVIGLYIFSQQGVTRQQSELLHANVQELMLHSRGMEQVLQKVVLQNELLTTAEQSVSERLYWKLSYVDQLIQENNASAQQDPARIKTLWNDRIDALTELSQLYYQRQQMLDDSEI